MAQLVLTAATNAASAAFRGGIGAAIGRTVASTAASYAAGVAERLIFGPKRRRVTGPRLETFRIQSSTEGVGVPRVFGRVRLAGQVIWAANFKESAIETTTSGGKGGRLATRTTTTEFRYSISFAVGLCEGVVDRIGRVWADGRLIDVSTYAFRFYPGSEEQDVDPAIEAIEGAAAPAFKGLAYVVFEDLPLAEFGDRVPQLSFEVERALAPHDPGALENALTAVTLIPGSGEFALGTSIVQRIESEGVHIAENVHAQPSKTDFAVALDALLQSAPNLEAVSLVVAWFGDSTDAGQCRLAPRVETAAKETIPYVWRAGGVGRDQATPVSTIDGRPAYGGAPADRSVIEAIAALKAKGLAVMLHPFILMDAPGYPWRGRIGVGDADASAAAEAKIAAFFGAAAPSDFAFVDGEVVYSGPDEWSFRRMILHMAMLAHAAGGVESFLLGSELIGITTARSGPGVYPGVARLRALAADVRTILGPAVKISYGADWTEWRGHQPSGEPTAFHFHLDPLWADENIDFIGVDSYAPRADWRDGAGHLDALAGALGPHDRAYLSANIEGGEGYDWHYPTPFDRAAQNRAPIADGAYGEPFIWRVKDFRGWWSNAHFDRPGGVRAPAPTAWAPRSKPIRFTEFGAGAVDKAANQPNVFVDPKSVETGLPHFSTGARDDLAQRRLIEAEYAYWRDPAHNPDSDVYDGAMIEDRRLYVYAVDTRPFPAFPSRDDVWGDADRWSTSHILNGRFGRAPLGLLLEALAGEGADAHAVSGAIGGYALDRPMSAREAIDPLTDIFEIDMVERPEGFVFKPRGAGPAIELALQSLAAREGGAIDIRRAEADAAPSALRLGFFDEEADHRVSVAEARDPSAAATREAGFEIAASMSAGEAGLRARALLAGVSGLRETASFSLPPSQLAIEPSDCVRVDEGGRVGDWRIVEIAGGLERRIEASSLVVAAQSGFVAPSFAPAPTPSVYGPPIFAILDLPLLGDEAPAGVWAAAFAAPWPGGVSILRGEAGDLASAVSARATMGRLTQDLPPGAAGRSDRRVLRFRLAFGHVASVSQEALLAGANAFAIETAAGWEVLQCRDITLESGGVYAASHLLRGQRGTEDCAALGALAGARIVRLDAALTRIALPIDFAYSAQRWTAAPIGQSADGRAAATLEALFTARALRPLSPVRLRIEQTQGGRRVTFLRRSRIGADAFDVEPPLAESFERYRLRVLQGSAEKRRVEITTPEWLYTDEELIADFGPAGPGPDASIEIAQISDLVGPGTPARLAIGA